MPVARSAFSWSTLAIAPFSFAKELQQVISLFKAPLPETSISFKQQSLFSLWTHVFTEHPRFVIVVTSKKIFCKQVYRLAKLVYPDYNESYLYKGKNREKICKNIYKKRLTLQVDYDIMSEVKKVECPLSPGTNR